MRWKEDRALVKVGGLKTSGIVEMLVVSFKEDLVLKTEEINREETKIFGAVKLDHFEKVCMLKFLCLTHSFFQIKQG